METITREDLYKKVWETPLIKVAEQYGLSDKGLAKICKKYNIPIPYRGYWQRQKNGWNPRKLKLPVVYDKELKEIAFSEKHKEENDKKQAIKERIQATPRIEVSSSLTSPHSLVERTKQALKKSKVDHGLYSVEEPCLNISVGPDSLERSLCIMDALLKYLECCGHTIGLSFHQYSNRYETHVTIFGEEVSFSLSEKIRRVNHVPTPAEEAKRKRRPFTYVYVPQYDYTNTGALTLTINEYTYHGARQNWSDGKRNRLENCLHSFVSELQAAASFLRERRLEKERQEQEKQRLKALKEEQDRRNALSQQLQKDLRDKVKNWEISQ